MEPKKIYHVGNCFNYSTWIKDAVAVKTIKECNIVLFSGGTDVFAGRYGEKAHPAAEYPDHRRDDKEILIFKEAVTLDKKIIGICRGSQLICVLNHGILVQDQPNPDSLHEIQTYDGKTLEISSTHHQAQFPFNLEEGVDYKLIAWTEGMLPYHQGANCEELSPPKEVEIAYYPNTKALAIQGHPEYRCVDETTIDWLNEQVELLLTNKL